MPKAQTCPHGITPQKLCEECTKLKSQIRQDKDTIQRQLKPKKTFEYTCLWCHDKITVKARKKPKHSPRFCTSECGFYLNKQKQKIMARYYGNGEKTAREISKLYKLGKDYKIKE